MPRKYYYIISPRVLQWKGRKGDHEVDPMEAAREINLHGRRTRNHLILLKIVDFNGNLVSTDAVDQTEGTQKQGR